jgi:cytochrome c
VRLTLAAVGVSLAVGVSSAAADVDGGAVVFKQSCASCHAVSKDAKAVGGPNLYGLPGRRAGATSYRYSPALKASGLVWTAQSLDNFLKAPAQMVPGSRMFVAVPNASKRADLVAYLMTLTAPSRRSEGTAGGEPQFMRLKL